jgi:hypothetical protein
VVAKYHVGKTIGGEDQTDQLEQRWESGDFQNDRRGARRFAALHLRRAAGGVRRREDW